MFIERTLYQQHIYSYLSKGFIHVLTGQRRVGKSMLLESIAKKHPSPYLLDMEQYHNRIYQDPDVLYTFLEETIRQGRGLICIDEIQDCVGRERVLISLKKSYPAVQRIVTGSNSKLLSSELTTHLRGRYTQTHILPFSYDEYCRYYGYEYGEQSFKGYIQQGSLPSAYQFDTIQQKKERMQTLLDTILFRDIIERYHIREPHILKELFYFVLDNTGSITNVQNIRNTLQQKGIKINTVTIQNYLGYLMDSYLIYGVDIYDTQGKKLFDRMREYYPSDHRWRDFLLGDFDPGMGKKLETIVYFELIRQGRTVHVGKTKHSEIDFIASKGGEKCYIQVAYILNSEEVIQREYDSLMTIRDSHPKIILSMDSFSLGQRDGIKHMPIWEWMKGA